MEKKIVLFVTIMTLFFIGLSSCESEKPASPAVQEIKLSPESIKLKVGETAILVATVVPAEASVTLWQSSNSSVAAVSNGKVFAGAITGTAVITAMAGGKTASCMVTVTDKDEPVYPLCHEVSVNIGIRTVTTFPSDRDPGPKHESRIQISGRIMGNAVMGRVEKIVSDPGYWVGLAQHGSVPVFTASSDYKLRDENDYSRIIFQTRGPLKVSVMRTEMDYVTFREGDKYVKVYDFLAEGPSATQAISLSIDPYFPSRLNPLPPLIPQYVASLRVLTYTEHLGKKIVGNGHSLKWDYNTMKLEPTGNELYMNVTGTLTEKDPEEGVESPLIGRDMLNNYFMNPAAGSLVLSLKGTSNQENSGAKTQSTIMIKLEFRSVPGILALPIDLPSPELEDWDWE